MPWVEILSHIVSDGSECLFLPQRPSSHILSQGHCFYVLYDIYCSCSKEHFSS